MKTIKVSEATEIQINWMVAIAQGFTVYNRAMLNGHIMHGFWISGYYPGDLNSWLPLSTYQPSTDPTQAFPIICREKISVIEGSDDEWQAGKRPYKFSYGPTPLIAAMRCYVVSKLGAEVEVPDELAEIYTVEFNGDCYQSVFPSAEAELSQLHRTMQDALDYFAEVKPGVNVEVPDALA